MVFFGKIVHFIANIVYLALIVYAFICGPMLAKYKSVVVLSSSMEPTFKIGSILYYKSCDMKDINVGDLITFNLDGNLVSHRVVDIGDGYFTTKGDANETADPKDVKYVDVYGKVSKYYLPYLGYYANVVNNNLILSIIISVIVLVLEFVLGILEKIKNKKKENESSEANA